LRLLTILFVYLLVGCSIINKNKHKSKSHAVESTESSQTRNESRKYDTSGSYFLQLDTLNDDLIELQFDNGFNFSHTPIQDDAEDSTFYFQGTPAYEYFVDERKIGTPVPVKTIIIRKRAQAVRTESSQTIASKKDTTHSVINVVTKKEENKQIATLQKKSKNYTTLVIVGLLSLVAAYIVLNVIGYLKGWEGIWFLFSRNKKNNTV